MLTFVTSIVISTLPSALIKSVATSGVCCISEKHLNDCKHVAIGTITRADAVVSWNCDDMVNPNRIPKYNEVNKTQGYPEIEILTPSEYMEAYHDNT